MTRLASIPVAFRIHQGDVTAILPTLPSNYRNCLCYAHVGQHGESSFEWYASTKAATPEQYAPLLSELRQKYETDGDTLRAIKRIPYSAWSKRV